MFFEQALQINPQNPYALLNLGVIHEKEGNRVQAIKMYQRVIALDPIAWAFRTTDPENLGKKVVDLARDNLKKLQEGE